MPERYGHAPRAWASLSLLAVPFGARRAVRTPRWQAAHLQAPRLSNRHCGALLLDTTRHAIVATSSHTFIVPRLAPSPNLSPGRCPPQPGIFYVVTAPALPPV
jgi:hypothetical protein